MEIPTLISTIILLLSAPLLGETYSSLWGKTGELWKADGRLPYIARAGYGMGEAGKTIPEYPVTANVKAFGAKGDGLTDDSAAFNKAITATENGAILIPEGRYVITNLIYLNKPNLVLRGEGNKSVLYFPKPLESVKRDREGGSGTSNYSWSGGFILLDGAVSFEDPTPLFEAKRGDAWVLARSRPIQKPGDLVALSWVSDTNMTFASWIYNDEGGDLKNFRHNNKRPIRHLARITSIQPTNQAWRIGLDRPIRIDCQPAWQPTLSTHRACVTQSGIENMRFEFPAQPWNGEFSELGYNAVQIGSATGNVINCWIRNVSLHNAESGIFCFGRHCTVRNIVFTTSKPPYLKNKYLTRKGCQGHHGFQLGGADNLSEDIDIQMCYVHDFTVDGPTSGNIVSRLKGRDLALDFHRNGPFSNVLTEIDCGEGNRVWRSGGGYKMGKNSAGWNVFWNLKAETPIPLPMPSFGPRTLSFVGVTKAPSSHYTSEPPAISPLNIYQAQRQYLLP